MGLTSSIMRDQETAEFLKLNPDNETSNLELPAPPRSRQITDKKGFIIAGILTVILVPFLIYALANSDIRRLYRPHDTCGNLCGVANYKIEGLACSGKDYTNEPYTKVNILTGERQCTDECPPGSIKDDYNCYSGSDFIGNDTITESDFWEYTLNSWWKLLLTFIITTNLCILTLVLFRYIPGVIVWGVTAVSIFIAISLTSLFWYAYGHWGDETGTEQAFLGLAILSTLFTIVIIVIFLVLFKKIQLIIQLYKETTKAMFAMPMIMLLPILTLFFQFLVLIIMALTTTWMATSWILTKVEDTTNYEYYQNGAIKFAITFNIVVAIWAIQFFAGCQYMILAGSLAQWFFKKQNGFSPIMMGFTNTVRFHLGSVALGAAIITTVAIIKAFIKSLIGNNKCRWLFDCFCGNIEALLKFLSKNAYIETAIHGQSFFRSGKRAAKLLITNAGSVIAINSVGDFIIGMTEFILLVISTAIAYAFFSNNAYFWFPTILSFFFNLIVISIVFSVFDATVDTLFVCFCEDMSINDGSVQRPYYMSTGLMQFVEDAKQVYQQKSN